MIKVSLGYKDEYAWEEGNIRILGNFCFQDGKLTVSQTLAEIRQCYEGEF